MAISGVPFVFADTAGLRDEAGDCIEAIGIDRAREALVEADLVLWLGAECEGPAAAWEIAAQIDIAGDAIKSSPRHALSAVTGVGLPALRHDLVRTARAALPKAGEAALNSRQRGWIAAAENALSAGSACSDPLLIAENLRVARVAFDGLSGRTTTEDMLDTLFGRFCIGK